MGTDTQPREPTLPRTERHEGMIPKRSRRAGRSSSRLTFVEIAIPAEDVQQQTESAERLGLTPLSIAKRGSVTRIRYALPHDLSLSP